jgi:hypothetical protein
MKNNFRVEEDIVYIELNRKDGSKLYSLVDLEDLSRLMELNVKWYADYDKKSKTFYCRSKIYKNGKRVSLQLHRFILDYHGILQIDHRKHLTLDNRKSELRLVTNSENHFNMKDTKGYYWDKQSKKWRPSIRINGKLKHLGSFSTESEAREAYLQAKDKYHIIERRNICE